METNLYTVTIPPMRKALGALSTLLDKAGAHTETKKTERMSFEEALMSHRLVFDQFDFKKQVQVACDNAKGCAARLAEIENPKHEDTEKTIVELKARIDKTVAFLDSVKPEQVIGKEAIRTSLPYFPNMHMTGFEYATEYALPNFYFHVSTAYNILRANGVPIGKADFIGGLPLKPD